MNTRESIRKRVAEDYARAVSTPSESSCCGGPKQEGSAVRTAGYAQEELSRLPDDAVVNAFGCGNPVAFSGVKEGDVVCDLGSGAGIDILLAAKKVGPAGRVVGVDMTDEMIARARENIDAAGLGNVEVRKGLIEDLPVESESVDWVISNCVINLSPEKERVFAEIARVLKPGGRIAISDVVVKDLPAWLSADTSLYSGCVAGAISEEQYVGGLRDAGLIDVEVTDRLVYEADQLTASIGEEASQASAGEECRCGCGADSPERAREIARAMAGKVWSAHFVGAKPACGR
ncbi:MAG: arsenite methyltransferase [Planctomycetota bacterium]|jgi:SAM-dependent methyltransferase